MTIDAPSGLIVWTPAEAQAEQDHHVVARVQEAGNDQLFDTQEFDIYVYPSTIGNGIEDHNYAVASYAGMNTSGGTQAGEKEYAVEGAPYRYQLDIWGPTNDVSFALLAGPSGMTIDENGLIAWDVPIGAKGQWVRVGITAEGRHQLEHDFYLHVQQSDMNPLGEDEEEEPDHCCHRCGPKGGDPAAPDLAVVIGAVPLVLVAAARRRRSVS